MVSPSSNFDTPLEKQVTKTLAEYIDRTIASPPKHQPCSDDNEYDVFLQNWQTHVAGIDMKKAYAPKPSDPAWVKNHDDYSINLVRLFVAAGERDPFAPTQGSSPPLSLDSVNLKYVCEQPFKDILFHIANATERSVTSKPPKFPHESDRVYEECSKKTFHIDLHQPYEKRPDDPHWSGRYSNLAINIVRISLAIRAIPVPQTRGRPRPSPRILIDSVLLKDITHETFMHNLHSFYEATRRAQERANSSPGQGAPGNSGEDESDEGDEDGWEADDDRDDDDEFPDEVKAYIDTLCDISSDSDDSISSADLSDDGISVFETDEERNIVFNEWLQLEAEESLPIDVIGPLLEDPKTSEITFEVLNILLGVEKGPEPEFTNNIKCILRELRMIYRISHTRTFVHKQVPEYKKPFTQFMHCYSALITAAEVMRRLPDLIKHICNKDTKFEKPFTNVIQVAMKDLKGVTKYLLPECRAIMAERRRIAQLRMRTCIEILGHCDSIHRTIAELFTVEGPKNMPKLIVNNAKCSELLSELRKFKEFDETRLGQEYFNEFPGCLVKSFGILTCLYEVRKLKSLFELRKIEDVRTATQIAGVLLEKWIKRSNDTTNSLFAPMRY